MKDKAIKNAMNDTEKIIRDVYSQGYNDGIEFSNEAHACTGDYERGLNDAWECARKIDNDYDLEQYLIDSIESKSYIEKCDLFNQLSPQECMVKIKEYEEKQKQEDDEIKIGDEIKNKWGTRGVVVEIAPQYNGATVYSVLWRNAERRCLDKSDWDSYEVWKKTGRHFPQIKEVLEQMKGEEE